MTIPELRKSLDLNQGDFARLLGLQSKSHICEIEQAEKNRRRTICSVRVALRIEELSEGQIRASDLNPDIGLVEQARGIGAEAA